MPPKTTTQLLNTLVQSDREYEYVDSSDEDPGSSVCSIDLLSPVSTCSIDLLVSVDTSTPSSTASPPPPLPAPPSPPRRPLPAGVGLSVEPVPPLEPAARPYRYLPGYPHPLPPLPPQLPSTHPHAGHWTNWRNPRSAPMVGPFADVWSEEWRIKRRIEELERRAELEEDQRLLAAGDYATFWRRMRGREPEAGPKS